MRKTASILILFLLVGNLPVKAHEGMWIPSLIKMFLSDMQADGLKLTADDIYAVNKSSLKDAIAHFGGGCTSEIVSDQGLLLTNHHCGFSQIQYHSSLENDYLKDGFWAQTKADELPNDGLTATFIVRIEDVTKKVLDGISSDTDPATRNTKIRGAVATLEKQVQEAEPGHEASIRPFYYGNQYFMIVTKTYRDVRLVGAPPSAVGKYGGDTDNWMWPRHTGDFSVFRIYANGDNEPADYSPDNKPYTPRHHFPVSIAGVEPGDFTMVYGFPGRTQQYLHSDAVRIITETMNPQAIAMREKSLSVIDAAMASSDQIRIQYAAKQARISNSYKKWIGENRGLEQLSAIDKKEELEQKFAAIVEDDPKLMKEYGEVLAKLEGMYAEGEKLMMARAMLIEFFYVGPEFIRHAQAYEKLVENFEELSEEEVAELVEGRKNAMPGYYKNYQPQIDEDLLAALYPMYIDGLDPDYRPAVHAELQSKYGGDWKKMAADLFEDSPFVNQEKETALLDKFSKKSVKTLKKDYTYLLSKSVLDAWRAKAGGEYFAWNTMVDELMRDYVRGMMEVFPDKQFWPDANSTLRLAWGKVMGSEPRDGVVYQPFTTLDGVLAKYVPGDREFDLPDRLVQLAKDKDYGPYGKDGVLNVCFTANNHTTGGNSGSPVLNAEGHLIGINFDRSWESTMSDIMYAPDLCRNITVDIRYVLFIMDKYANAGHLVEEMTLIKE